MAAKTLSVGLISVWDPAVMRAKVPESVKDSDEIARAIYVRQLSTLDRER
jgi:hypothetical protein